MVTELIRAVNYFTGYFQQPIKLEVCGYLAARDPVDVDCLMAIGFIRKVADFAFHSPRLPLSIWLRHSFHVIQSGL